DRGCLDKGFAPAVYLRLGQFERRRFGQLGVAIDPPLESPLRVLSGLLPVLVPQVRHVVLADLPDRLGLARPAPPLVLEPGLCGLNRLRIRLPLLDGQSRIASLSRGIRST